MSKSIDIIVRVFWVIIKSAVFDFKSRGGITIGGVPLTGVSGVVEEVDTLGAFTHFLSCVTLVIKPMLENREQVCDCK